jgi:diketogulonate reductase-like aldo/keto reductase
VMTAYSPLSGADLADPVIAEIAERHGVSPAVVVLRWLRQHNCVVLPKSLTPQRIADNLALPRSFALSEEEMQQMVRRVLVPLIAAPCCAAWLSSLSAVILSR